MRAKVAWHTERRTLEKSMRQVDTDRTRVSSQRQLPTDHDYAGGQRCSIREYQSDQPSSRAASTFAQNTPPPKEEGIKKKKKEGRGLTGHFISDLRRFRGNGSGRAPPEGKGPRHQKRGPIRLRAGCLLARFRQPLACYCHPI